VNVAQLIANILITASSIVLVGLGFSLIYRTTKFFNLAYAFLFVVGPYFVLFQNKHLGFDLHLSLFLSVVIVGIIGVLLDILIYRPLRRRNASSLVLLLSSLGVYVILQNMISLVFGDESISIRFGKIEQGINIIGARITSIQIELIGLSVAAIVIIIMLIRHTRIGLAIRAVSSSPELANVSGIQSERVIFWTTFLSSIIVGLAGVLVAIDVNMNPTMGMNALMVGIVAVLIGGMGSIPGVVLGALFLSSAQHLVVWVIGSQWQDAIAFVILLAFLLLRPEGFMGKRVRKTTV
jgi:branched-chain amino acid transport system permease protein